MSPAGAIDQMLEPLSRCLDAESARRVAALSFPAEVQDRMDVVSILKLKARDQLSEKP
jgi:hypothetical protein